MSDKKVSRPLFTVVFALFSAVMVFAFCGCGGGDGGRNADEVLIWHWMTDRQDAFAELAEKYKAETGIAVKFQVFAPSDIYQQKVIAAIQGNLLPDVYGILSGEKDFASFIKGGHVFDLTADMDKGWRDELFDKAVLHNSFVENNDWGVKPGVYGVPIDVNDMLIVYNKDLFAKAGLDPENPPETWKEFLAAGTKLRAAGIQPFVAGFGESWLVGALMYCYQWHIIGRDKMVATIKGEVGYDDADWIKVFSLYDQMRSNEGGNMFASGLATMINKYSEQVFSNGQAAMALNGSWCVNVYNGMNPDLDYGVMLPPTVEGAAHPMRIWGGGGSSFVVNGKSPRARQAVDFLRWMTAREQQIFLAEKTRNIPSNRHALDGISPVLRAFADAMDLTWDKLPVVENWEVVTRTNTLLQSIIIGEKTPEEVGAELAALKKKVSNKQ